MYLSEAIRDWASYSRTIRGYTKQTHRCYLHRQRQFARWLEEEKHLPDLPVHEITSQLVRQYLYCMCSRDARIRGDVGRKAAPLRPRTVRAAMHSIRALFAYLVKEKVIDAKADPTREVELPKLDAAHRLLVSDEDLARLLEATARQRTERRGTDDGASLLRPACVSQAASGPRAPRAAVGRAIGRMPAPTVRRPFVLRPGEGLSFEGVGRRLLHGHPRSLRPCRRERLRVEL
jgi:integrase